MKSHIIGFLLVTLAQIPMPIKIGTNFQNKLRPTVHLLALSLTPCQQTTGVEEVAAPVSRARMAALSCSIVTLSTLVTAVMCSVPAAEREPSERHVGTI